MKVKLHRLLCQAVTYLTLLLCVPICSGGSQRGYGGTRPPPSSTQGKQAVVFPREPGQGLPLLMALRRWQSETSPSHRAASTCSPLPKGAHGGSDGKESACSARDPGFNPCVRKTPGGGNGNPLQYSCLGNPMNREVLWATVHGAQA